MHALIKFILVSCCFLLTRPIARADLRMLPLSFELTDASPVYEQGAVMEFRLRITNQDKENTHPVLLPAPGYRGDKFIYLTAYTVSERNFYTEVAREEGIGLADTNAVMYTRRLKPGEFVDISLKLYEKPRYGVLPSEPHWFSKPLSPGTYQFLAWYQPYYDHEMYKAEPSPNDKSQYNGQSNYCKVEIKAKDASKKGYGRLEQCGDDCDFCKDIEERRWGKVRRTMEAQIKGNYQDTAMREMTTASHGYWLDQHTNVVYISPWPESILAIFPGRIGRTMGFKSKDSVHYFHMTIQLGKIYRVRSRIQSLIYCMGNFKLLKTTDEDYIGLHNFTPASSMSFYYGVD